MINEKINFDIDGKRNNLLKNQNLNEGKDENKNKTKNKNAIISRYKPSRSKAQRKNPHLRRALLGPKEYFPENNQEKRIQELQLKYQISPSGIIEEDPNEFSNKSSVKMKKLKSGLKHTGSCSDSKLEESVTELELAEHQKTPKILFRKTKSIGSDSKSTTKKSKNTSSRDRFERNAEEIGVILK